MFPSPRGRRERIGASAAVVLPLVFAPSIAAVAGAGCGAGGAPAEVVVSVPADFPPMPVPADNPLTAEGVAVGKALFYETRLSRTNDVSCATCHLQGSAYADGRAMSVGVEGRAGRRNALALVNVAWNGSFLWDGAFPSLEEQVLVPLEDPLEMDSTLPDVVSRLAADPVITRAFARAYGEAPSAGTVARSLASFLRSLVSGDSRFDRWSRLGTGLTDAELRGRSLFLGDRAGCYQCHAGFNFTSNEFRNNGVGDTADAGGAVDVGRAAVTLDPADSGKFRVPTLRNVAASAPYMHDGSIATLEEVIDHYDRGGRGVAGTDPAVHPLGLDDGEKADLAAFLRALTDDRFLTQQSSWEWSN